MKPERSPHETATLPTLAHERETVSLTSAAVSAVVTTSTSFMTVAGLKKCMPMTDSGRVVAAAELGDRQRRGGRRQDRAGLADPVEVREELRLDVEVLGDGLDDDVDVGERLALGGAGEPAEHRRPWRPRRACRFSMSLVQPLVDAGDDAGDLVLATADEDDVVPGLGEDLGDAGGHGAGADHADLADLVLELRSGALCGASPSASAKAGLAGAASASVSSSSAGWCRLSPVSAYRAASGRDGVGAELVESGQRALRVAAAELHRGVDVAAGGVPLPRTCARRGSGTAAPGGRRRSALGQRHARVLRVIGARAVPR